MAQTFTRTAGLFAAVPMFGLATGAMFPLVALELEAFGKSSGFIGNVTTAYYFGAFVAAATFGLVQKSAGPVLAFVLSATIAAAAAFALRFAETEIAWLLLRFTGGYALGAYYTVIDGWFQGLSDRSHRGKVFAAYETLRLASTALGPSLLIFGSLEANQMIIAGAYVLSILPILTVPRQTAQLQQSLRLKGVSQIVACFPAALALCACGGFANASFYGLSAIYATEMGWGEKGVALFIGIVLVAPAASEIPIGAAADRFGRLTVAIVLAAGAVAACIVLAKVAFASAVVGASIAALAAAAIVPLYALGLSRIADASPPGDIVDATTACLVAYNLGAFAGPAASGVIMDLAGPGGLYMALAACAFCALLAAVADRKLGRCCPEHGTGRLAT